jgi:hypothetical protein
MGTLRCQLPRHGPTRPHVNLVEASVRLLLETLKLVWTLLLPLDTLAVYTLES